MSGDGERFLFVHMHKTAGTTLRRQLEAQFADDDVYPTAADHREHFFATFDIPRMLERVRASGAHLVSGHFPLATKELLGPDVRAFTVLREPVARTLSALRHIKQRTEPPLEDDLAAIYADPLRQHSMLRNHMVKMLSLDADDMEQWAWTLIDYTDERLEVAKRRLAEEVEVFGLQEHYDESTRVIATTFGWALGPSGVTNATQPLEADPALVERIREDSALDIALYEFAVDLWEERWGPLARH